MRGAGSARQPDERMVGILAWQSPLSPFRHAILTIRNLTRPARRLIEAGV